MRPVLVGVVTALVLCAAIYLGSRELHNFDSALAPYAIASVFLAFGIAYRYTAWISSPGRGGCSRRAGARRCPGGTCAARRPRCPA
ncbi:hypothetical protein ACFQZ4_00685 [Catellatospora coxensis]